MRRIGTISLVAISALALSAGIAHASTPTAAHAIQLTHEAQPGDDKGDLAEAQPGDDKGDLAEAQPGDDKGDLAEAQPGDDKGDHHHRGGDHHRGGRDHHRGGHGSDD
jgi:hypothetical protein